MEEERRQMNIPLAIDLNEIPAEAAPGGSAPSSSPPSSDPYEVVFGIHGRLVRPVGPAAEHPGEAGCGSASVEECGSCGRPETRGGTLVCDGCERGFHLACLGSLIREQAIAGDWLCGECMLSGPTKNRWVLGEARRLLDINELPPTDCDGDQLLRNRVNGTDKASVNGGFGEQYPCQDVGIAVFGNHSGRVAKTMRSFLEATTFHGLNTGRGFEDLVSGSSLSCGIATNSEIVSGESREEFILHSLRDFITEKGGVLAEGWHVEFKQSPTGSDSCAVYCAPDGMKFESIFDVAHYLGISFGFTAMETNKISDGCGATHRVLPSRRRKKDFPRDSVTHKFIEKRSSVRRSSSRELPSKSEAVPPYSGVRGASGVASSYMEENGAYGSQNSVGLPVQYDDFFITRLGKVDLRMAYHDKYHIWPIGYRSSWHDKVTGSFFECEVSEGGDSGPVFKVRRCPCSMSTIPTGATILLLNKANSDNTAERTNSSVILDAGHDKDDEIKNLLLDLDPSELNFLSCFDRDIYGNSYGSSIQMDMDRHSERIGGFSGKNTSLRDEIGEFYVEGRSSSSVWKMVSQTLIDACHEVYKQSGCLQFCCRHDDDGMPSSCRADCTVKDKHGFERLTRFSGASGPINTPKVVASDKELEITCKSLTEWLEQDRFGLDMGFVQEIIETLPSSRACSGYLFLSDRNDFSLSLTVGSGLLLATQKNGINGCEEVVSYGLYSDKHRIELQDCAEDPSSPNRQTPPGRPLSSNLPAELAGDVFQISEFLWRFCEILGLKEPLSFEEVEEELVDPWPCSLDTLKRIERETGDFRDQASLGTRSANYMGPLHIGTSDSSIGEQNENKIVPVETAVMKEAAQDKVASCTYGRCTGLALSKVHISLLKVLVGELISKLAAHLDPNLDARESKSRRGRKKDADNSFPIKDLKNEMLSINELTWPELARRYVLAVLSMNGRMESQEVFGRESVKVFRCLQGDGGVLCGSLPGIAGMEADSLLLAEAERQISDTSKLENKVFTLDYNNAEEVCPSEPAVCPSSNLPDWAKELEPVRKLPTNVGTRIRSKIYDALAKNPPEWAKEILLHSISKEVYKGNASGPTKKAVLQLLAIVTENGKQQQKPDKAKKVRKPISVSDAITKKCRIVLRHAVSADESKTFCNLLGTALVRSNVNNDEGIVGSPAMVSRPLDFRTIDLRLAVGAYCGSHESFLEDVREVWHNLCIAYGDRPDLMQKIEKLSQNFESLYEEEVLHLFQKLAEHSAIERLDDERLRELNDVLVGGNEIPKAPWEDGVCKVCGIDKDDDSVLLCDSCDSEYHRYCLNPPLAKIPEGNWYCPSCVSKRKTQDKSKTAQEIKNHPRRRLGDGTCTNQDTLDQLATIMKEREYWEFCTEERIILLKFLCDEVLNSALIREHLDQCADKTSDLQQKLRALTVDWRNLKFKEEILTMRSVNDYTSRSCGTGDAIREETMEAMHADQGNFIHATGISKSPLKMTSIQLERCLKENGQADGNEDMGRLLKSMTEKHADINNTSSQLSLPNFVLAEGGTESNDILNKVTVQGNPFSIHNGGNGQEQIVISSQPLNTGGTEMVFGIDHKNMERLIGVAESAAAGSNVEGFPTGETNGTVEADTEMLYESNLPLDKGRTSLGEDTLMNMDTATSIPVGESLPVGVDKSEPINLEVNSLKDEFLHLQESFASLESQLMMTSLRRDFLGRDSIGRSYWVIGKPGKRPWLVVGGSISVERTETTGIRYSNHHDNSYSVSPSDPGFDVCCLSPLVIYESDFEIQQLVGWLRDGDPRERELKECILQWQRLLLHQEDINVSNDPNQEPNSSSEIFVAPQCSTTKASIILENKYGSCSDLEVAEIPKKRGRKTKISNEERMYRCECLEPVWPSRHHCLSCHQTCCTVKEFEGHNGGRCNPANPASDEVKDSDDLVKGKGIRSESIKEKDHADDVDSKGMFDASYKFVRSQRKTCPYDFEEICEKFVISNCNKALVKDIGLIGSNGIPTLISSPPVFFDPPLFLNQKNHSMATSAQTEVSISRDKVRSGPEHDTKSPQRLIPDDKCDLSVKPTAEHKGAGGHSSSKVQGPKFVQSCMIPESSLRPLVGKVSHIIKRLKINLLDMDAALLEEALRPSKSQLMRRCAWRTFVKSAESIYEMVQATILLELMIRSDYLKNGWWYWSSLTAAVKTPTISSLALRIYTLDDCIIYIKDKDQQVPTSSDHPTESSRLINKIAGRKKKDIAEAGPS